MSIIFSFDIVYRYRMCSISKVTFFDIEGHIPPISKVTKGKVDIEVSSIRYRTKMLRYRIMISYTISKAFLTFDIEGLSYNIGYRYRIRFSIHPMSFTAERKPPLPRRHHAGAEGSQRHEPWFPAPSFCAIPQLDPQRFDEEMSFHSATSTC
jgi:hypothetical protein